MGVQEAGWFSGGGTSMWMEIAPGVRCPDGYCERSRREKREGGGWRCWGSQTKELELS